MPIKHSIELISVLDLKEQGKVKDTSSSFHSISIYRFLEHYRCIQGSWAPIKKITLINKYRFQIKLDDCSEITYLYNEKNIFLSVKSSLHKPKSYPVLNNYSMKCMIKICTLKIYIQQILLNYISYNVFIVTLKSCSTVCYLSNNLKLPIR